MNKNKNTINRRDFLSSAAAVGAAGAFGAGSLLASCGNGGKTPGLTPLIPETQWNIPDSLPDKANDGRPLKVGLVGCGNRGTGAVQDLLKAADNLSVVALGDLFQDRIDGTRKILKEKMELEVPDENCFTGFDSYLKVINSDIDLVLLASPPAFRPLHFKAAVNAGKHAFLEKPMAVDPAGCRSVIASSKKAVSQGLVVITGTQRHHERKYIEGYKQVQSGLIGKIQYADIYWNTGSHWYRFKEKGWTDMEWMIRDWGNWTWLSGDHIVEQHVHNIDVVNWFLGRKPVKATGFGAHLHRNTGDQFDMFSINYLYEDNISVRSMCRQIDGCSNRISEFIQGTEGSWSNEGVIKDLDGNVLWKYDSDKEKAEFKRTSGFVLEHVNMINHIRGNKPISQAEDTAISTLTAIMGRMSAYTGEDLTWEQVMGSDLNLVPEDLALKDVDMSKYAILVPGKPTGRKNNQR
ncbi:MAG: Gfo/Idh/MocA family oxidoreductase [Bacteroidales bacterium]|jgi:predicted dehydrogenase|nr:Gfo/Idh/MocA family oxidoreductase [Bacteroidales bacterium]